MRKKGFTLIELVAVIVILAVIALIAVPLILSLVNKSRLKAAEESALFYVDTIENMLMMNNIENTDGKTYKVKGKTVVDENNEVVLNLEIKGDTPYNGVNNEIKINSGFVEIANLRFNAYYVHYEMDMETKEFKTCTSQKGFLDKCDGTGSVIPSVPDEKDPSGEDEKDPNDKDPSGEDNKDPEVVGKKVTLEIGDYIQMTPKSNSYAITTDMTGCLSTSSQITIVNCPKTQPINPSELNLWRVIRKNDDETYDMVSHYISNKVVYVRVSTGFTRLVDTLNKISAQYTDEKNIVRTRHMGFDGQIEVLTDSLLTLSPTTENSGKGDTGYLTDTNLVSSVYKTLQASTPNKPDTFSPYWLASRSYLNGWESTREVSGSLYRGRFVNESGTISDTFLYGYGTCYNMPTGTTNCTTGNVSAALSIRPIITLAKDFLVTDGDGSFDTPYILMS